MRKFNEYSYLSIEQAEGGDPQKGDFSFGEILKDERGFDSALIKLENI